MAGNAQKTLRLKVEARVGEARKEIEKLQKDLQNVSGVSTNDQAAVVDRVAKQYESAAKSAAKVTREANSALRNQSNEQRKQLDLVGKMSVAQSKLDRMYGATISSVNKIVSAYRKQGSAQEGLLRAERALEKVVRKRAGLETSYRRLVDEGIPKNLLANNKKEIDLWRQREKVVGSVLRVMRKLNAEQAKQRESQERSGAARSAAWMSAYAAREKGSADRALIEIEAANSRLNAGIGSRHRGIVGGINSVSRFSRITGRNAQFDSAISGAELRLNKSLSREKQIQYKLDSARASGNERLVIRSTQVLRVQKAVTTQMRAELDLTKKTVAERTKFLRQSWWERKKQGGGAAGTVARGAQMGYGHVAGAYQKITNFAGGVMRVYWSFLSIFYLLRNVLQLSIAPLGMLVTGLRALVGFAIGAAKEMLTVAGETESLEARLTSFKGISPGITNWVVGQAVGKPFEWTQIGEALQRTMAMGAPNEKYAKETLMPGAYDLAASFMTKENQGTILRDAAMAIMQGAHGNFSRLTRSFGFVPSAALDAGAAPGQGGRGVSSNPKDLQQNLDAILKMVNDRVGGTSEEVSNTLLALHSDMEDIRKGIAATFAETSFFSSIKTFMMAIRESFITLRESGKIKAWMDVLSDSFQKLTPVIYSVLPYLFSGLQSVFQLLGFTAGRIAELVSSNGLSIIGEKFNLVISTIQVVMTNFVDSMASVMPKFGQLFLDWIRVSISASGMALDAILRVGNVFIAGLKALPFGHDKELQDIQNFIGNTRNELFRKDDPDTKEKDETGLYGLGARAVNSLIRGLFGGGATDPAIQEQMKTNRETASTFPTYEEMLGKFTQKGTYLGTKQDLENEIAGGVETGSVRGSEAGSVRGSEAGSAIGSEAGSYKGVYNGVVDSLGALGGGVMEGATRSTEGGGSSFADVHNAAFSRYGKAYLSIAPLVEMQLNAEQAYYNALLKRNKQIDEQIKANQSKGMFEVLGAAGEGLRSLNPPMPVFPEPDRDLVESLRMMEQAAKQGMKVGMVGGKPGIVPLTSDEQLQRRIAQLTPAQRELSGAFGAGSPFSAMKNQFGNLFGFGGGAAGGSPSALIPHAGPSSGGATKGSGNVPKLYTASDFDRMRAGARRLGQAGWGVAAGATGAVIGLDISAAADARRIAGGGGASAGGPNSWIRSMTKWGGGARRPTINPSAEVPFYMGEQGGARGAGASSSIGRRMWGGIKRGASAVGRWGKTVVANNVGDYQYLPDVRRANRWAGAGRRWAGAAGGAVARGAGAGWDVVKRLPWPFIKRLGGYAAAASIPYDVLMGLLDASPVDSADISSYEMTRARRDYTSGLVRNSGVTDPRMGSILSGGGPRANAVPTQMGGGRLDFGGSINLDPVLTNSQKVHSLTFGAAGF